MAYELSDGNDIDPVRCTRIQPIVAPSLGLSFCRIVVNRRRETHPKQTRVTGLPVHPISLSLSSNGGFQRQGGLEPGRLRLPCKEQGGVVS